MKNTLIIFLLLFLSKSYAQNTVFPTPTSGVEISSLVAPTPSTSANQGFIWDGSVWSYADWDTYGPALFPLWDQNAADDFNGSYSSLSNVPTTFTPATHTHLQSEVTGLVTALAGKEPLITATTTADYLRGDKTFAVLDKAAVGLGNVDNTTDINKPISTLTQTALNAKFTTPTGTTSQYLRGDGTLGTLDADKGDITISTQGTSYLVDNAAITNAKLANMPSLTIKGNNTGVSAAPLDLTVTEIKSMLGRTVLTLATNVSTNTVTPVATALSFNVVAGQSYKINFNGQFLSAATTTGIGLLLANGTAAGTLSGQVSHSLASATLTGHSQVASNVVAYSGNGTSGVPGASTNVPILGEWVYNCTTSGTVTLNFRSEIAASNVTLFAGSKLIIENL